MHPCKIRLAFLVLIASLQSFSQDMIHIQGKVVDDKNQAISTGDAFILSAKDSSIVKYAPVVEGSFQFSLYPGGNYLLKISCLGHQDYIQPLVVSESKFIEVTLSQRISSLEEVRVSSSKTIYSTKNGNLKVNIENSVLSAIANPVDLLSKLPSIQASLNGESISVVGKGEPVIYIDNQKITLNDLNSLSVNDIKTIEIINNPSSKYDAEGRAVILITRKISKRDGLRVDLTQNASLKRYYHNRSGINLSLKKRKVELKSNFQYNHLNLWESNGNHFVILGKDIASDYKVTSIGTRKQYLAGSGIYYQINEEDYLSLHANARVQKEPFTIRTHSSFKQDSTLTNAYTTNYNNSPRAFLSSNLNYNRKVRNSKGTLFFGAQYSNFSRELESAIWNSFNGGTTALSQDRIQRYGIDVFTSRVDFTRALKNDMSFEVGSSYSTARANALLQIKRYNPAGNATSDYRYAESIYAAYSQLSGRLKEASYTAGVRVENTGVHGQYRDNTTAPLSRNYTQLFPKASLQLPLDSTKTLSLNYAKTVKRPNYSATNQITTYINPFFEWSSNINLAPTISQEVSALFQYKENSLQLAYTRQKFPIYYSTEYDEPAGRLRMVDKNLQSQTGLDLTLSVPLRYKMWSATNSVITGISRVNDPAAAFRSLKPYLYVFTSHQVRLPKDYIFSLNAWGLTKRHEGIFERNGLFSVDTTVSKTFDKKLTCTVSFNDIFRSLNTEEKLIYNSIASNGIYYEDVREFSVALKYSFGSFRNSKYKNREVDENATRIK